MALNKTRLMECFVTVCNLMLNPPLKNKTNAVCNLYCKIQKKPELLLVAEKD
jgi:hypothetical protein